MEERYKNIKQKYKAIGDTVLLAVDAPLEKNVNGIIIAETQELTRKQSGGESATVLHVSTNAYMAHYEKQLVKEGDHILFTRYAGREIKDFDDDENPVSLRWVYSEDIFGFVNGELPDQNKLTRQSEELTGRDLAADQLEERNRRMYDAYKKQVHGRKDANTLLHQFAQKLG